MEDIFEVDLHHGFNILMNVNVTIINNSKTLRKDKSVEQLLVKIAESGSFEVARFINIKLDHLDSFLENISPISLKLDAILLELSKKKPERDAKAFQLDRIKLSYPDAYVHTEPSPLSQKRFGGNLEDVDFIPKKVKIVHARHVTHKSRFPKPKNHKFNDRLREFHQQLDSKKDMVERNIVAQKNNLIDLKRNLNHRRINVTPPAKRFKTESAWTTNEEDYDDDMDPLNDIDSSNEELQNMIAVHKSISELQNVVNKEAKIEKEKGPLPFEEMDTVEEPEITEEKEAKKKGREIRKWFYSNKEKMEKVIDQKETLSKMIQEDRKSNLELHKLDFSHGDDHIIGEKQEQLDKLRRKFPSVKEVSDHDGALSLIDKWKQLNQVPQMTDTIERSSSLLKDKKKEYVRQYFDSAAKNPHLVRAMKVMEKISKSSSPEEIDKLKKESMTHVKKAKPTERRSWHMARQNLDFYDDLNLPKEEDLKDLDKFMKEEEFHQEQMNLNDLELEMKRTPYNKNYFSDRLRNYWEGEWTRGRKRTTDEMEEMNWMNEDDVHYHEEMLDEIFNDKEELKKELKQNEETLNTDPEKMYKRYSNVIFNQATLSKIWDSLHSKVRSGTEEIPLPKVNIESDAYNNAVSKFRMLELLLEQKANFGDKKSQQYNKPYINYNNKQFHHFYNTENQKQDLDTYIMNYFSENFHDIEKEPTSNQRIINDLVDTLSTRYTGTEQEKSTMDYKRLLNERYDTLRKSNQNPTIQRDVYDMKYEPTDDSPSYGWKLERKTHGYVKRHLVTDGDTQYVEEVTALPSTPRTFVKFINDIEERNAHRNATNSNIKSRTEYFRNKRTSDNFLEEQTASGLEKMKKTNPTAYKLAISDYRSPPEMVVVNDTEPPGPLEFKFIAKPMYVEPHENIPTVSHSQLQSDDNELTHKTFKTRKNRIVGCSLVDGATTDHFLDFMRHPEAIMVHLQINHSQEEDLALDAMSRILSSFTSETDTSPIHHMQHMKRNCKYFFRKMATDLHHQSFPTHKMDEFTKTLFGSSSLGHSLTEPIKFSRQKHGELKKMFIPCVKSSNSAVTLIPLTKRNQLVTENLQSKSGKTTMVHSLSPAGGGITDAVTAASLASVAALGGYGVYKGNEMVNYIADQNWGQKDLYNPNWEREKSDRLYRQITDRLGFSSQTNGILEPPPAIPRDPMENWNSQSLWPWPPELKAPNQTYEGFRAPMVTQRPMWPVPIVPPPATQNRYDQWMITQMLNRAISFLSSGVMEGFVKMGVLPPVLKDTIDLLWTNFSILSNNMNMNPFVLAITMYQLRGQLMGILKTIPKPFQWIFNKLFSGIFNQTPMNKTVPTPDMTQLHTANPLGAENLPTELSSFLTEIQKNYGNKDANNTELTVRALNILGYPTKIAGYILKQITTMGAGQLPTVIAHGLTPSYIAKDMVPKMLKAYPPFYKVLFDTNFVNSPIAGNSWSSPTWKAMGNIGPSLANLMTQTNLNRQLNNTFEPSNFNNYQMPLGINPRPEITTTPAVPAQWWKGMLATIFKNNEKKLEKEGLIPVSATQLLDTATRNYHDVEKLMNSKYEDLSNDERRVAKNLGNVFDTKLSRALFKHAINKDENMDRNPDLMSDNKFLRSRTEWSLTPDILMPTQPLPSWWDRLRGNWSSFSIDKNPNVLRNELDEAFSQMSKNTPLDQYLDKALTLTMPTTYKSMIPGKPATFTAKFKPKGTVAFQAQSLAKEKVYELLEGKLGKINEDLHNVTTYLNDRTSTVKPTHLHKPEELFRQQSSALSQLEQISQDEPHILSIDQLTSLIDSSQRTAEEYKSAIQHDILDHNKKVENFATDPKNKINSMWSAGPSKLASNIYRIVTTPNPFPIPPAPPLPVIIPPSEQEFEEKYYRYFPPPLPPPPEDDEEDEKFFDAKEGTGGNIKKMSPEMWYAPNNTIVVMVEPNKIYTMCSGKKGGALQSLLPLWDSNIELRGHPSDDLSYNLENNWFNVTRDPSHISSKETHSSFDPVQMPILDQMISTERNNFNRELPAAIDKVKIIGQLPMTQPTLMDDHLIRTYKFFGVPKLTQAPIVSVYKSSSTIDIVNDEVLNTFLNLRDILIPIHLKQEENHALPLMTFIMLPKVFY